MERVIAEAIQQQVGRELKATGANYDDLQVTPAKEWADPFVVNYKGLSDFKSGDGTAFNNSSGKFSMTGIGGGQWQGSLAGTPFTVQVGKVDDIDLPFINDPNVIGEWKSVDLVSDPTKFDANRAKLEGEPFS